MDRTREAARRLQVEFPGWSFEAILRLCRELGEEAARRKIGEASEGARIDIDDLRLKGS